MASAIADSPPQQQPARKHDRRKVTSTQEKQNAECRSGTRPFVRQSFVFCHPQQGPNKRCFSSATRAHHPDGPCGRGFLCGCSISLLPIGN